MSEDERAEQVWANGQAAAHQALWAWLRMRDPATQARVVAELLAEDTKLSCYFEGPDAVFRLVGDTEATVGRIERVLLFRQQADPSAS